MRRLPTLCALFVVLLTASHQLVGAERREAPSDSVRRVVNRSLPYLQKRGEWWIKQKKCTSCHRVTFMIWSLIEADRRGFAVDRKKLDGWIDWSLKNPDKNSPDTRAQLLLAVRAPEITEQRKERLGALRKELIAAQQKDGSWKPGGQLPSQKRPKPETTQVSTIWNSVAVLESGRDASAVQAVRDKALKFLAAAKSAKSTEWFAARLLLEHRLGHTKAAKQRRAELFKRQNPDGGWGWIAGEKSDALATGMGLYALLQTGAAETDHAVQNAVAFLLKTQNKNGSWTVNGTKANKQRSPQETATYWGTAWATIGLLQTLPVAERK